MTLCRNLLGPLFSRFVGGTTAMLACPTSLPNPHLMREHAHSFAERESQNPAPLMLYLEEHDPRATTIKGGWFDAKALLAISDGG
jgi:hypothetical protein